jgi:hypothetical protein
MQVIRNQAILDAEIGEPISSFSGSASTILANVGILRESVDELMVGSNCDFIDSALTRLLDGVCKHLKNAISGFTAILIGAGVSNLVGVLFTVKLNLYLHQKAQIRRIAIK